MPVKTPPNKGTSPSKLIQNGVNQSWGGQVGTTDPKQALADKFTNKPVPPSAGNKG